MLLLQFVPAKVIIAYSKYNSTALSKCKVSSLAFISKLINVIVFLSITKSQIPSFSQFP